MTSAAVDERQDPVITQQTVLLKAVIMANDG